MAKVFNKVVPIAKRIVCSFNYAKKLNSKYFGKSYVGLDIGQDDIKSLLCWFFESIKNYYNMLFCEGVHLKRFYAFEKIFERNSWINEIIVDICLVVLKLYHDVFQIIMDTFQIFYVHSIAVYLLNLLTTLCCLIYAKKLENLVPECLNNFKIIRSSFKLLGLIISATSKMVIESNWTKENFCYSIIKVVKTCRGSLKYKVFPNDAILKFEQGLDPYNWMLSSNIPVKLEIMSIAKNVVIRNRLLPAHFKIEAAKQFNNGAILYVSLDWTDAVVDFSIAHFYSKAKAVVKTNKNIKLSEIRHLMKRKEGSGSSEGSDSIPNASLDSALN